MIEINSIEDLKPFMKYVPAKYVNGYISYLSFEIVENGEVQDVAINCQLDLTYSFDNIFNNLFNVDEIFANDYMSQGCDIRFIAKVVIATTERAVGREIRFVFQKIIIDKTIPYRQRVVSEIRLTCQVGIITGKACMHRRHVGKVVITSAKQCRFVC